MKPSSATSDAQVLSPNILPAESSGSRPQTLPIVIGASLLLTLALALAFPMVTDESYYVDWARRSSWPSLGFFDHPPFVSWLASGVRVWHDIMIARVMVWLSSLISIYFIWKTAKLLTPDRALIAVALMVTTIGGIAGGFLLTPDTGLSVMWSIAIHEAVVAIQKDPRRWLTAGAATGLGLLSKYTMVLIGPVFLWGLIRDARKQLSTPWPYLGGIICVLIFAPHLWWQSQNDWITMKFQFGHGFSVKQSLNFASTLPKAEMPEAGSPTMALRTNLLNSLAGAPGIEEATPKPKPDQSKWERSWQYLGDYAGGVAGLWGVYALAALYFGLVSLRRRPSTSTPARTRIIGQGMIEASAFLPLIFFSLLSPFTKIEANWPAMHMASMAIWIASRGAVRTRTISTVLGIHIFAIGVLALMMIYPESFPGARNNRLLLESKGYRALGEWVRDSYPNQALAVDSYQLKSALRYYAPGTEVAQWPGITRGSEYSRGFIDDTEVEAKLMSQPTLTLISMNSFPLVLRGFQAVSFEGIRVCPTGILGRFSLLHPVLPCTKGLREWWITNYKSIH
jgi:Dolichyl-phosphate-mannose-protein mannosyltransferase